MYVVTMKSLSFLGMYVATLKESSFLKGGEKLIQLQPLEHDLNKYHLSIIAS